MIYLEETLNLAPASPETLDTFVGFAQGRLAPAWQRLGARLVAAWYSDIDWFCQVTQILEFDDLGAFEAFRAKACQDPEWTESEARLAKIAAEQSSRLLEPLGPVPPETLHKAIAQSRESPVGAYSLAVLQVLPGRMSEFISGLEASAKALPIVASWRAVAGKRNQVIDIWKGALRQSGYQAADEGTRQFFRPLREIAPRETLRPVFPLPYSPLR